MSVYYFILFIILGLAYPLLYVKPGNFKKALYIGIVFLYLFLLSVFRYGIGNDYFSYIQIFEQIYKTDGLKALLNISFEPGFVLLTKALTTLTMNTGVLYALFSVIILAPVAFVIYKYSKNVWLSCYLYITLTFFYTTMNFIRQSIAASVILLGYKFLKERKTVPFIIMVLLASSFHYTALIMLPVYFLSLIKPNKYIYISYAVLTAASYTVSYKILNLVFAYGPEKYKAYKDSFYITTGLSFKFIVIPLILLAVFLFCFFYTRYGKEVPEASLFTNLVIFNAAIWLFITKHFILERFSMYVYIFIILAMPDITEFFNTVKALKTQISKLKQSKNAKNSFNKTKKEYQDARYLYVLLLTIIMLPSFLYNIFGMYDGSKGFHGIFPYQSGINIVNLQKYDYADKQDLNQAIYSETDLYEYLLKLSKAENYIVVISNNASTTALSSDIASALKELGFEGKFTADKFNQSYIGVSYNNKSVYENVSCEVLSYETDILNNKIYVSSGNTGTPYSEIKINEQLYPPKSWGLNIAVYDAQTNLSVDSATFYPYTKSAKR